MKKPSKEKQKKAKSSGAKSKPSKRKESKTKDAIQPLTAEILPSTEKSLALSYVTLRKVIGVLGTLLPFVVSLGGLVVFGKGVQSSISSYYYTGMRDVLVGTLFAIGFFLYSYEYDRADGIAGKAAFAFALGVALFPTTPDGDASNPAKIIGGLHLIFAALFFLTLSYFCLFLFTKTHANGYPPMTVRKMQRNNIYKVCGYVMIGCILLMGIYNLLGEAGSRLEAFHLIYWLEAIAIVAFGISWLTKGEAILKDES